MLIFLAIKVDDVFSTENSGSTCHYERLKNKYVFHCDIIVMILLKREEIYTHQSLLQSMIRFNSKCNKHSFR